MCRLDVSRWLHCKRVLYWNKVLGCCNSPLPGYKGKSTPSLHQQIDPQIKYDHQQAAGESSDQASYQRLLMVIQLMGGALEEACEVHETTFLQRTCDCAGVQLFIADKQCSLVSQVRHEGPWKKNIRKVSKHAAKPVLWNGFIPSFMIQYIMCLSNTYNMLLF